MSQYKVIRATTSGRRPIPSSRIDPTGQIVVRVGSWEECERFLVDLKESKIGWFENRWAGRDMLVRIGRGIYIVYRIMPDNT